MEDKIISSKYVLAIHTKKWRNGDPFILFWQKRDVVINGSW